jgi:hypothetical protein
MSNSAEEMREASRKKVCRFFLKRTRTTIAMDKRCDKAMTTC